MLIYSINEDLGDGTRVWSDWSFRLSDKFNEIEKNKISTEDINMDRDRCDMELEKVEFPPFDPKEFKLTFRKKSE